MNNNQNWNNLGDQFRFAVQDAIRTGDFRKLNYLVTDTVTDVIVDASSQFKQATIVFEKEFHSTSNQTPEYNSSPQKSIHTKNLKCMPISKTKNVGNISRILLIAVGGIGTLITVGVFLFLFLGMVLTSEWSISAFLFFQCIVIAIFFLILRTGIKQHLRLLRMKRYISFCDDNMYINISDLALYTQQTIPYVLNDIKDMLKLGFFPEGHLDKNETCLMLDDQTYQEYLRIEHTRKDLEIENTQKKDESTDCNLQSILTEGETYISKLHYLNDLIEDEIVSEKLYLMENLLKEIFSRLEDSPEQMPKIRKLMSYYLPTTIKLLQSYSEFDDVSTPNQDIVSAKNEIEKTIDIINEAFTELVNKLFQSYAFDAAADAQVLQTMLAQEGLTKNKILEDN